MLYFFLSISVKKMLALPLLPRRHIEGAFAQLRQIECDERLVDL